MLDSLRDQLYPCLLVTRIDIIKISLVTNPKEHAKKLISFLQIPDIDAQSLWEYARNVIWTFNAFAVRCILDEKPSETMKLFRIGIKLLDIKNPTLDWSSRDEWKILKIIFLRNMAYFYCKFMDYKLAISQLIEVEKLQKELSIETLEKIDVDSPFLVLSYLYLIGSEIDKAMHYAQIVASRQKGVNTYRKPEFLEPSILSKKDQVHKAISNFIWGKCELHKQFYQNSLEKYKQGISYLKNCDVFTQSFKDAILVDFNFIRTKIAEQRRASSPLKSPSLKPKSPELKIDVSYYPEIKLTQTNSQRELKVKTNRSDSNLAFHSPQHRFSFGYGSVATPQTSQSSLSKINASSKTKLTARFNKSIDKIENLEKNDETPLRKLDHEDSIKIPLITQPKTNMGDISKISPLDIKYNNFVEMINPRPQIGTFRRIPSISIASEVLPNSTSSRRENVRSIKKPQHNEARLGGILDHLEKGQLSQPPHNPGVKLPSLIEKIEGNDLSEYDVDNLAELVDFMNGEPSKLSISKQSIRQSENDTLNLSAVKVESIGTVVNSLSSIGNPPELKIENKEEKFKGMNAKEFSLHIFKTISNKEREPEQKVLSPFKKLEDNKGNIPEKKTEEDESPPIDLKELKRQIREAEKICASKIQRWYRRAIKNKPPKLKNYALPSSFKRNEPSTEGLKNKRILKNLTITYDTITHSEDITSKDSITPPTLTSLQVPKLASFPRKMRTNNQAILINQDYLENNNDEMLRRSQSIPVQFGTSSIVKDKFVIGSLARVPSSLANLASPNQSKEFSPLELQSAATKEKKSSELRPDDEKTPVESSSGNSTLMNKGKKRQTKKYRPGFKDSYIESGFNQSNYIRSKSSLHRSKSSTERSFLYESKKLPEELNETTKLRIMRRYTELKEFQNVNLRFNKAFMKKDEVWFFKYSENSWNLRTQDKKDLILYFQLYNSSKLSVGVHIPFCDHDKITSEKFVTIWPIVLPSIKKWFEEQSYEEEYELYETENLKAFPKRMHKKIEKAMTQRGLRTQSKFTTEDKRIFQIIQKRLIFLIDKKIIQVSKVCGKTLFIAKSSIGEKVQSLYDKKTSNDIERKSAVKMLATDPNISLQNVKYDELSLELLKEINDLEKQCFEEIYTRKDSSENKEVQTQVTDAKKVRFENPVFSCYNILSKEIIFHDIFKLKEFYWFSIILNSTAKVPAGQDKTEVRRFVEIVVEPSSIQSISRAKYRSGRAFKIFTFSLNEFLQKCAEFLEMTSLSSQSLKKMSHYFKTELTKKLSKMIVTQADSVKLSSKFQKVEEQDDPFAKATAFYRLTEKNTFQDLNFEKSMIAYTDNDYLFEKNFKEIYGKHFISLTQKYFNYRSNNDFGMEDLDNEEIDHDLIFRQKYIDDDEATITNNAKPEVDLLDNTLFQAEHVHSRSRHYFKYKHQGTLCYIRIICDTNLAGKNFVSICYYHPNREQLNYVNIIEKKLMKRIKSILERPSPTLRLRSLKSLIEYGISYTGRVLHIKSTSYDVNLIQRKYVIPVNPAYLKIDMLNQSNNLESAFETWTLHFIHKFSEHLGKCYIKLNVYRKKVLIMTDNITPDMNIYYFSFEINPEKSKTKQFRLLLNSLDIKSYLNMKIEGDSSFYFMKLSRNVLDRFIVWKRLTSKILALPMARAQHDAPDNQNLHVFYNTFSVNTFETKLKVNNYLEPKNYCPKIIYQGARKFNKNFYVITIEYVHRFDYWNIHVYNPKTSRNFICTIFFEEILNWKNSFLKKIYPSFMNEFKKYTFMNYQQFANTYWKHYKKVKKKTDIRFTSSPDIPSSKRSLFTPLNPALLETLNKKEKQLFFKIDKVYSLPFLRRKKDQTKTYSSRFNIDKDELSDHIDFFEFKFWENVVKNLEFSTDNKGRDIVKVDNFEGRLSELIFGSIIQIDKSVDCLIEIHIENNHEKRILNSPFENITYLSSINNILYIKIYFFNLVICQREKLYLREIINLNIADGLYKYQANYIDSKMNLADLQNICGYIIHKIRSSNLLTLLNESPLFSKRFSIQQKSEYRIKIKTNALTEPDNNMEEKKGLFFFRKIIASKPFISASVYYDKHREIFMVYLYRFSDCALVVKEYKMKQIRKKIPMISNYMEAGLYAMVGRLIIESNENFLNIYATYTYNILDLFKNR